MVKLQAGYREIAKILGVAEGTLRTYVDQLRKAHKLSTGPRGPGAVNMTAADASIILFAFLYGKAADCVETAERIAAFRHASFMSNMAFHRDFVAALGLNMEHTAVDMLTALLSHENDLTASIGNVLGKYKSAWQEKIAHEQKRHCTAILPFLNLSYAVPDERLIVAFGYEFFTYIGGDHLHTINIEITYREGNSFLIPFTDFRRVSSFGLKTIKEISALLLAK